MTEPVVILSFYIKEEMYLKQSQSSVSVADDDDVNVKGAEKEK